MWEPPVPIQKNTAPAAGNQAHKFKSEIDRHTLTDSQELYALLGQIADLADHARRGLDLAGYQIASSTVAEMIGYARETAKLTKKMEGK